MKRDFVKKLICYAAVTATLTATFPAGVYAATWVNDGMGNYYFYDNNSYAVGWRNIDGSIYYFDNSGMMQKGWMKYGDSWYYLDNNGALKTGWINYNGEWYYSDSAGIMQTGILQINGKIYCFGNNGVMKTGSIIINGQFYTIGSNGALISNRLPVPDKIFDSNNNCINQINSNNSNVTDPNGSKYNNPIVDQSEDGDYDIPVRKFTVTFRDENGEELKTKKVTDGDTVKMYEPDDDSDEDREFIEWNTKRDGSGKSYEDDDKVKVTKDLTLYAVWSEVEEKIEVSNISISGDSEVEAGKSIQLTADVKPSDATNSKVKWSIVSSGAADEGKATIDKNGVLTGIHPGKIVVKAEAEDKSKVSVTKEFKVVEAKTLITGITISSDSNAITEDGGILKLHAAISPESASTKDLHWKIIEGAECADINNNGELRAIKDGKVKVQASAKDGSGISSNTLEITISGQSVKAAKIIVSGQGNKKKISAGSTLVMRARVIPDNVSDSNTDVVWEAKYTTGVNAGKSVEITSISEDEAMNGTIADDHNDAHKYKYARLKADYKGKIEVTARSKKDNSIVGKTTITAVKDAENISITATDSEGNLTNELKENNGKLSLRALFTKADGSNSIDTETDTTSVKWGIEDITNGSHLTSGSAVTATSCDKAYITTSAKSAVLTAVKDGKVRIYAMADDETKVVGYIDVEISGQIVRATGLTLETTNGSITSPISIKKDEEISIIAKVDDKATNKKVSWVVLGDIDSIDYDIEPYDEEKKENKITIKAKKNLTRETSVITVKAFVDDIVKECNINVIDNVKGIVFNYDHESRNIIEGQTINISAVLYPTHMSGKNIEWSVEGGEMFAEGAASYHDNVSTQKFVADRAGRVKIKAEHFGGYSSTTEDITILHRMTGLSIESDESSVGLRKNSSKTVQLRAIVRNSEYNDENSNANANGIYNEFIEWSAVSDNSNVTAAIDHNTGRLTVTRSDQESSGSANITIKAVSKSS
ncbi:MAG: Ig-like domain-containing protein, partial [Clostridium sp.]